MWPTVPPALREAQAAGSCTERVSPRGAQAGWPGGRAGAQVLWLWSAPPTLGLGLHAQVPDFKEQEEARRKIFKGATWKAQVPRR